MRKKLFVLSAFSLAMASGAAFAQSGGISIPGLFSGNGSAGSTVRNSTINVVGNRATNITAGGGQATIKVLDVEMDGTANVNSVNITGSEIASSEINVIDNEAEDVQAIGGTANVNSVNIN